MFIEQVGKELKAIRLREGLTLENASKILGIHKNTLSIYENNPSVLKIGKLYEILLKYKVDMNIFFGNIREYIRNNELVKELEDFQDDLKIEEDQKNER